MSRLNLPKRMFVLCLSMICTVYVIGFSGCQKTSANANSTSTSNGDSSTTKKLPKLRFHQPRTFDLAVKRVREIFEFAISDEPMPAPKTFRVLEVVHGTGAAGHSHYYLAKNGEEPQEPEDDHGHVTTDKKIHEVNVDVATEMIDIFRWLPEIAATGDMGESDWKSAKKHANEVKDLIEAAAKSNDDTTWRNSIKDNRDQIESAVKKLETLSAKPSSQD